MHALQRLLQEPQGLHGAHFGAPFGKHGAARGAQHQHQGGGGGDDGAAQEQEEGGQVGRLGGTAGERGEAGGGHHRQGAEGVRGAGGGGQPQGLQQEVDGDEFLQLSLCAKSPSCNTKFF